VPNSEFFKKFQIRQRLEDQGLTPFLSLLFVIATLLGVVFVKMEVRRVGYSVLRLSREKKIIESELKYQRLEILRMKRPERIEKYAQKHLEMQRAERAQVIQIPMADVMVSE
jgi:cell division protein FtsL